MAPVVRRPGGTPTGGQFTSTAHPEAVVTLDLSGVSLDEPAAAPASNSCTACEDGITADFTICAACDGSGTVPA